MKKIFIAILILLSFAHICLAAEIFHEGFEDATDYDEDATGNGSDWNEATGGASPTIDPNYTGDVLCGDESFQFVHDGTAVSEYIGNTLDSELDPGWLRWEVKFTAESLSDTQALDFGRIRDVDDNTSITFRLYQASSQLYIRFLFDSHNEDYGPISLDTEYLIELYMSAGSPGTIDIYVNKGLVISDSSTYTINEFHELYIGDFSGSHIAYSMVADDYILDDADYPADPCQTRRRVSIQ